MLYLRKAAVRASLARSLCLISLAVGSTAHAQTFTTLVSFEHKSGECPGNGALVQELDGDFYGTTSQGGSAKLGTAFAITPRGQLKNLDSFNSTNGSLPYGGLMLVADGTLYGTEPMRLDLQALTWRDADDPSELRLYQRR